MGERLPWGMNPTGQADVTPNPGLDGHTLALRVVMMPRDTNHYGTIFGGVILSYIDQAGFVEARRHNPTVKWVTVAVDRVEFKSPVQVGDVVNFFACTSREGRTSVTVEVDVRAERHDSGQIVPVTSARLVMVAVDGQGRAVAYKGA